MISKIHPIPAFTDNYIWAILDEDSNSVCVVDPGEAHGVTDYLHANNLSLAAVLITHHHPDHIGGLAQLSAQYQAVVYGPESSGIKGITKFVAEGDRLELFGQSFTVLEVPGHTLDHIAYYCDEDSANPILFCGDTLFAAGCGRIFEGTPEVMYQSLVKLANLGSDTIIYCTHEYTLANLAFAQAADPANQELIKRCADARAKREASQPTLPSTMEIELTTNPFLRCNEPALRKSAENQLGSAPGNEVEVFSAIRGWKDNF
ncbi:MAG: hydroxyacylglutathione hydrolase [Gammaproteobacteria bacterium]|nr:hydroxyacylglutathione hydrolase [Gammaproteobacteria bacterium]MDP7455662.1 hydroxyacylglutathione hydrolase [Gammaproteobacteria bacterium]